MKPLAAKDEFDDGRHNQGETKETEQKTAGQYVEQNSRRGENERENDRIRQERAQGRGSPESANHQRRHRVVLARARRLAPCRQWPAATYRFASYKSYRGRLPRDHCGAGNAYVRVSE
jgi:hypothetical protein